MLPGYLHLAEQGHRLVQSYLPLCRRFMLPLVGIPENDYQLQMQKNDFRSRSNIAVITLSYINSKYAIITPILIEYYRHSLWNMLG